jgi:beta-glucosidase
VTELSSAQEEAVEAALAQLDLETKVAMLSGQDVWSLPPVPAIGLASIVMSDGPVGVRGTQWSAGDPSIALPSPTALAATWDPALARQAGRLLGQEARRKGVHVLLAPTVNLHRSPLGGRHFEAYSEDPLLTGEIGTGYVTGVQEHGVATTVKHFVANDFETERFTASAQVSDRALRELYLAPFEAIVARAAAWGVMSAYNAVNGVSMTENAELQLGVLKDEWGFDGVIVSDWMAARDTTATANAGLDIAMPAFGAPWGDKLVSAVRGGEVPAEVIDEQARRVLRLAARVGALAGAPESVPPASRPPAIDGEGLAREVARRSFVLAANAGGVLPLDASGLGSLAVIGALAKDARVLGGGSATVFPEHVVSPLEGLAAALPDTVRLTYAFGADPRTGKLAPAKPPQWTGLRARFTDAAGASLYETTLATGRGRWMEMPAGVDPAAIAAVEISGRLTAEVGGEHQLAIRGIGRFTLTAGDQVLFDGEVRPDSDDMAMTFLSPPEQRAVLTLAAGDGVGVSLTQPVSLTPGFAVMSLSLGYGPPIGEPDELLAEAEQAARDADVAVVVVGTTDEVESEGFDRTTLTLPGRQDELVTRVAAANPGTIVIVNAGSPVELPWADEVAAVLLAWFPGQEAGHALADVLLGAAEPGGRLPTTWPVREGDCPVLSTTPTAGVLAYDEGVFIGYRAWDRGVRGVGPLANTAGGSAGTESPRSVPERTAVAPRYPFGHGLGYTDWQYERLTADRGTVTVTVRNTGSRAGREVVQVYAGPVEADETRPRRWLAGFADVTAGPGESATATIDLPGRTWQVWADGWQTIAGEYRLEAAHSLADVRLQATIAIT